MGKFIGGILLIVGTCVGAGILALPATTAPAGFLSSSLLLILCWLMMTTSALLILEVSLWFPIDAHMLSMAKRTLGVWGQALAWFTYLVLLYALLSAYIAGGSDIFTALLKFYHISLPHTFATLSFTFILSIVVYGGTRCIDYVNRGLMLIKLSALAVLLICVLQHVKLNFLMLYHPQKLWSGILVMICSFGFSTIVPSLKIYFHGDVKQLRRIVLLGSLIPLILYILWDLAILGSLPSTGPNSLAAVLHAGAVASSLMILLQDILHNTFINQISRLFTSVCVATSFLGVSLCLVDFLADGFSIKKKGVGRLIVYLFTFLPPILIVLFEPHIFVLALNYAGTLTLILLAVLPVLMVWRGRYYLQFSGPYRVWGGKPLLVILFLVVLTSLAVGAYQEIGKAF